MPSEEHYNDLESNYFILFLLSVIALPSTYLFVKHKVLGYEGSSDSVHCSCSLCKQSLTNVKSSKGKGITFTTVVQFLLLVGLWGIFFLVVTNVQSKGGEEAPQEVFDPFQILGIDYSATPEQIKKAHRELSLIYHPDKVVNATEATEAKYISIVKAYKALTDEISRENWLKYGNPDGPQAQSIGIALPPWLVRPENTLYVLGVYLTLLIVGLPSVVCCWWRSWKKYDSTKVMNSTMGLYYHKVEPLARVKVISELISASQEYQAMQIRSSDEQHLTRIAKLVPDIHAMKRKPKYNVPYALKTNALFYAQMSRLQEYLSPGLKADLAAALVQVRPLLGGFITICTNKGLLVPILEALQFLQILTQSTWNKEELLQLPHITSDMADIFNSKKKNCGDLAKFTALGAEKRAALLKEEKLNDAQIKDVEFVLQYLPKNVGIKFNCKVEGEDSDKIVARSVVTCFFKVFRGEDEDEDEDDDDDGGFDSDSSGSEDEKTEKTKNGKKGDTKNDKDEDKVEKKKKEEEKQKRKKERKEKRQAQQQKKKKEQKEDSVKRFVHAPNFPEKREECWWIVIGDTAKYELVGVHRVGPFGKKIEGKVKFLAPAKPGTYTFTLNLVCDGYLGCDKQKTLKIHVVADDNPARAAAAAAAAKKGAKIKEISDPDEDGSDFSDDDLSDPHDDDSLSSGSESD